MNLYAILYNQPLWLAGGHIVKIRIYACQYIAAVNSCIAHLIGYALHGKLCAIVRHTNGNMQVGALCSIIGIQHKAGHCFTIFGFEQSLLICHAIGHGKTVGGNHLFDDFSHT